MAIFIKKTICAILAGVMAIAMLSGCNGTVKQGAEKTTLKWMMLGPGEQTDSQAVMTEFNNRLEKVMPDVNLELEIYPIADYDQKWKLYAAANAALDLAWTGWLVDIIGTVNGSAYMQLDDLIEEYAPDIKNEIPDQYFKKINGGTYFVPNYQMMFKSPVGLRTHKEISDKYWDVKRAAEIFAQNDTMNEACYDVIEEYLKNAKENGDIKLGVSPPTFIFTKGKGYYNVGGICGVRISDKSLRVVANFEMPETKLYFDKMAQWYQKGYIRKDIITVQDPRSYDGKQDGSLIWAHSYFKGDNEKETAQYGFPIEVVPMDKRYYYDGEITSTGTAIPRGSKNPETAMKLLNLMNTKKGAELYNLLVFGLEGQHYKKISDIRIETFDYADIGQSNSKYGLWKWAVGNTFNAYLNQAYADDYNDYIKGLNEEVLVDPIPLIDFVLDKSSITTELAQCQAVSREFQNSLATGTLPDHESVYAEMVSKMKKAGSDKIVAETQRQVDEYLKAYADR
ncbi:MAG: ABC transporter substrate-binding protein [Firmicutes bacterium]|nr:ABC transporter substrate-binding protein [Bacillota bacterium]